MEHKVYIQSCNGFPVGDWGVTAYMGWRDRQTSIIFFEEIDEVPASPFNIVVADITTTNSFFKKLGIPPKKALNVPKEIEKYAGRWIKRTTIGDINKDEQFPFFIKGNNLAKEIITGVVNDYDHFIRNYGSLPHDTEIMISEVVNFVSEYRVYIVKGIIKGIYWYNGDIFIFPDSNVIKKVVDSYTTSPAGYVMDFGITDDGKTLLVECNDGWSIGNYGLQPGMYVSLLAARWLEIISKSV